MLCAMMMILMIRMMHTVCYRIFRHGDDEDDAGAIWRTFRICAAPSFPSPFSPALATSEVSNAMALAMPAVLPVSIRSPMNLRSFEVTVRGDRYRWMRAGGHPRSPMNLRVALRCEVWATIRSRGDRYLSHVEAATAAANAER